MTTYEYTETRRPWLPPELWRECLRWATLPPSGRLPLHDPPTCLDIWSLSIQYDEFLYEGPDVCYSFEQSALYPTKRKLHLVCKLWAALSAEFLYECIIIDAKSGANKRLSQLLATLRRSDRGRELAMFVKRIDFDGAISPLTSLQDLFIRTLSILPNLRVLRSWRDRLVQPLYIALKDQPVLRKLSAFLTAPDTIASIDTTLSGSQLPWKALTVVIDAFECPDMPGELPTLNQPMLHLKHLTLVFNDIAEESILLSLSRLQGWSLPSLTHFSFHLYSVEHMGVVKGVVGTFGRQLEFLALTGRSLIRGTDKSWFCELLTAAPNIKEFVFCPRSSDNISFEHLPPAKYGNIEVIGLPVSINYSEEQSTKDCAWYIRLCMQAFPSLRLFRITGVLVPPDPEHERRQFNEFWVRRAAIDLRSKGIRFEDRRGRDLWEQLGTAAGGK
jgi:hypothetical protein